MFKEQFTAKSKIIFLLSNVVLFIHLDCFGVVLLSWTNNPTGMFSFY